MRALLCLVAFLISLKNDLRRLDSDSSIVKMNECDSLNASLINLMKGNAYFSRVLFLFLLIHRLIFVIFVIQNEDPYLISSKIDLKIISSFLLIRV